MKKIITLVIAVMITTTAWSQNLKPIAQKVTDAVNRNASFEKADLFNVNSETSKQSSQMKSTVTDATVLQFKSNDAQSIISAKPAFLNFVIPVNAGYDIELQLYRSNIFTPDFIVVTSGNNGQPIPYSGGVHYWGIIKGDNHSLAAISIFDNEVMGLISVAQGNLVLGKIENDASGNHILYNDRNLNAALSTDCFTVNDNGSYEAKDLQSSNKVLSNCIRLFWEVNLDIYNGKGSVANAVNYVTGIFNQSAIIYTNDAIPVELAEVFVWNTTSPYTSTSTSGLLGQFQSYRNTINGDLGHLLGYAGGGGVAAGFSGLCASNLNSSQCYSGVQSSFNNVPTYSWTVMVVTHEQGHLMGSRHTHACVWNGNNTAIDGCGPAAGYGYEGSCSGAPIPPTGGTIMSYCHLNAVGINFNNGFGTQPKNVIINNYNNASCLSACIGSSCMPPANMSTTNVLSTTATFNWAAATGASSYNVRYRIVGTGTWTTITSAVSPYNATGLTPGSNYEWQVQTVCAGGSSIFTISMTFTTTPLTCLAPTNLSTTNISSSSVTFNWSAASGATSYNVRYRIVGTGTWTTGTTATTTFNASGLTQLSNYEWQVQTLCSGGGTSSFSSSATFTTTATPCNPPYQVYTSNITATTATFNFPGTGGGVGFNIRYRIVGAPAWITASATTSPYIATGLTPLSNYELQIQTVCTNGTSAFTSSTLFTTLCATPPASITANGPTTFCAGGNVLLTANSGSFTYQWLLNGNPIPGMVSMNYPAAASGNYSVVVTSGTCSATSSATTVTVNPLPTVTAANVSGCTGTSISLSGTPAGGTWSVANPYTGSSTTYTHTYTDGNGCTNTSAAANITVNALPSVSFSGLAASYNVSAAAATLIGSPAGGTFSGPGISGNIFTPAAAGIGGPYTISYAYTDGNGCSNSSAQQTTVTNCAVTATPGSITSIGGTAKMCPGDSKSYKITAVSGASSYTWTPPAGASISAGQGTVQVTVNYTAGFTASGILSVVANNACGSSAPRNLTITRNTLATPSVITGLAFGVCNNAGVPYSVTNVAGATYNWSFSVTTAGISTGQGSNAVTADYSAAYVTGALRVTATNACGTSPQRSLTVKATPATPAAISGPTLVCANQFGVPYSITPIATATSYTWTGMTGSHISDGVVTSAGASLTTTATSVTVNFGSSTGKLNVKANNACGAGTNKALTIGFNCRESENESTFDVTVYPNPSEGDFILNLSNLEKRNISISIYDLIGKLILSDETRNSQFTIHNSQLKTGIYSAVISNGEIRKVLKLVKTE